ncbi:MAG: cation:proton antiporter [Gammaproteobacteria bacterium]|nr:cation:proton antiporter [Gammaproteobacteria bacterium]
MHGQASLLLTIAASFGLALAFGFVAARLRLPVLVGYMLAGVVLGPGTPGFVANVELSRELAEIGVILLMFGVGLRFSLDELIAVRGIALPGALLEMTTIASAGAALAWWWGWEVGACLVFGLSLSVASTVVLVRSLERQNVLESITGHIALGWLVVEDLAMVLVLVLLPPLAGSLGGHATSTSMPLGFQIGLTLLKVAAFVALMMVVGKRLLPKLLWSVAHTGSRELFTLSVVAGAIGVAYAASLLFGVSFALGAFFAGIVMRESSLAYRAAQESLPLRDAFAVLFFVSVGMLFDPHIVLDRPLEVLGVTSVIVLLKPCIAFSLVTLFRYPLNTAITIAIGLAQIGEFSYILAGLGLQLGLLEPAGLNLILAGSLISIGVNPLLTRALQPLHDWLRSHSRLGGMFERPSDPLAILPTTFTSDELTGHVVLVGYGRVGRRIGRALMARGQRFVVIENSRSTVEDLRAAGLPAVAGDAADPEVLIQGHIVRASMLIIAMPDAARSCRILEIARMLNPGVRTIARAHSDEEAELLVRERVGGVFYGEQELANAMIKDFEAQFAELLSASPH